MTYAEALGKLEDAKVALSQAAERLQTARRGALSGAYNPRELGEALTAYRQIKRLCQVLRAKVEKLEATREQAQTPPFEPTPHMRFIRWLAQAGRLSDW